MTCRGQMPEECGLALGELVRPLRDRRMELGLTQAQLGRRVGCDRSRVSRVLSGREVPPLRLVEEIARALGADADQVRRQWAQVDAARRQARACEAGGMATRRAVRL